MLSKKYLPQSSTRRRIQLETRMISKVKLTENWTLTFWFDESRLIDTLYTTQYNTLLVCPFKDDRIWRVNGYFFTLLFVTNMIVFWNDAYVWAVLNIPKSLAPLKMVLDFLIFNLCVVSLLGEWCKCDGREGKWRRESLVSNTVQNSLIIVFVTLKRTNSLLMTITGTYGFGRLENARLFIRLLKSFGCRAKLQLVDDQEHSRRAPIDGEGHGTESQLGTLKIERIGQTFTLLENLGSCVPDWRIGKSSWARLLTSVVVCWNQCDAGISVDMYRKIRRLAERVNQMLNHLCSVIIFEMDLSDIYLVC